MLGVCRNYSVGVVVEIGFDSISFEVVLCEIWGCYCACGSS